jgi:hypothetical protein
MRRDDGSDIDALKEAHLTLRDGTPVLIRRLMAEDAALYPDFLSNVTAEDRRLRFFGPIREVSHELLDKLIHYDPACAMAFIAVDEQSQKMLGVVRLHDDTSGQTAEFAILVRSRLKDHGVGWLLMKHMIEFSKRVPHILMLILADIIRRSSGGNLGIRARLEQGHKWLFNRNGS